MCQAGAGGWRSRFAAAGVQGRRTTTHGRAPDHRDDQPAHIGVSLLTWQNEKIVTAPMPLRDYVAVAAGRECAAWPTVTFTQDRVDSASLALTIEIDDFQCNWSRT